MERVTNRTFNIKSGFAEQVGTLTIPCGDNGRLKEVGFVPTADFPRVISGLYIKSENWLH